MSPVPRHPAFAVDLVRLARVAWRERKLLLRFHAAVAVLAVGIVLLLPRWYSASVTLVPAPKDGLSLDFSGLGAGLGGTSFSFGAGPTPQDQLKMVVMSRAVSDSLITRFDLVRRWKLKRREQAREQIAERVRVVTPKEGQVIVDVEARTPELARDMAAAYAHFTASETARLKTSLAGQRRLYLEARLRDLEREIVLAGEQVRSFEEKHGAVALPEQTKETMDAAGTLQAQVALLETELAAARRYFTDEAPPVAVLRDRITELNRQVNRLARQGGTLLIKGADLPALKQEFVRLSREQMSLTAVSELLRRVYEQARVEEANPVASFSLLDAADLPERPSRPKRALTVLIALGLSAASSLAWLQWREMRAGAATAATIAPSAAAAERTAEPDSETRRAA
jgi:uncharacterized protein involved in exopolysaccharide biosynthesis